MIMGFSWHRKNHSFAQLAAEKISADMTNSRQTDWNLTND